MSLLPINSDDPLDAGTFRAALAPLPRGAPVVVLIHGFKFCPSHPETDPHRHILALRPQTGCWKAISWPRHLGLAGERGLALAFGWNARASIWEAYRAAGEAGFRLAALLRLLRLVAPGHPVHILGHSLGARVALSALPLVPAGSIGRVVLISAAAFRSEARAALESPPGRRAETFSVGGRENALFDALLRLAMPLRGPTLGGASPENDRWLDLPLDRAAPLEALRGLGYRIAPPPVRVCHWSGYLRPGVWPLYRALLLTPERTPMPLMRRKVAIGRDSFRFWSLAGLPLPSAS